MSKMKNILLTVIIALFFPAVALSWDIHTLDKVHVLMTRSQVVSLLGVPEQIAELKDGLQVEIYRISDASPLVGTGCLYDNGGLLTGQTYLFQGEMGREAAAKLKTLGFSVLEERGDYFRFLGKDDDTGHPLVVQIGHENGLTVVSTFEKDFYDRRLR